MRHTLLTRAWLQWALWLLICGVSAHLSLSMYSRFDLTHDQRHSRAQATFDAVRHLERPLQLDVWFTEDLGPPYQYHLQAVRDLLADLQDEAGDTLHIRFLDPTGDALAIARARRAGIRPITYARQSLGKSEARQVWMGIALSYGERATAVDAIVSLNTLEQELTRAILSVRRDRKQVAKVGWLQGHGEPSLSSFVDGHPLAGLRQSLAARASLVEVQAGELPKDLDALLIVGPQQTLSDPDRYALDQFVMNGGATGWFITTWQPDFSIGQTRRVDSGLATMLGGWGIGVTDLLVLDRIQNERMTLPIDGQWLQVNTPLAPSTRAWNPIYRPARDLGPTALPFATALELHADNRMDLQVWLQSEPSAVRVGGPLSLDPQRLLRPQPGELTGAVPLVVALQGQLGSQQAHLAPANTSPRTASRPVRMVVAGSADVVANQPDLLRNTIDWLLEDQALLGIRARKQQEAPLPPPSSRVAWALRLMLPGFGLWALGMLALLIRKFSP